MKGGSLRRWHPSHLSFQKGRGFSDDLVLAGVKESLGNIDINCVVRQGLSDGIQSIDKEDLKSQAKKHFKRGVRKEIKRKASNTLPARAAKRVKRSFSKRKKDIFD